MRPIGTLFPPYCFLGNGTEEKPEQSDVIGADCCNQLAVLGRYKICHISAPVVMKETKPHLFH